MTSWNGSHVFWNGFHVKSRVLERFSREVMGVTKMRNETKRSAARGALQNVSNFVRYLLIMYRYTAN